jgi:hypothetical protein
MTCLHAITNFYHGRSHGGGPGGPQPTPRFWKMAWLSTVAHCSLHCSGPPLSFPLLWPTLSVTVAPPMTSITIKNSRFSKVHAKKNNWNTRFPLVVYHYVTTIVIVIKTPPYKITKDYFASTLHHEEITLYYKHSRHECSLQLLKPTSSP